MEKVNENQAGQAKPETVKDSLTVPVCHLREDFQKIPIECEPNEVIIGLKYRTAIFGALMLESQVYSGRGELSGDGCFAAIGPFKVIKSEVTPSALSETANV